MTDGSIYSIQIDSNGTMLVKPIEQRQFVKGPKIKYKKNGRPQRPLWKWKRTFHVLDKWEKKQSSHYAYEFIGRR